MVHIVDTAREAEVFLNGRTLPSKTMRARLAAATRMEAGPINNATNNYIAGSITLLAGFGIYIRDRKYEITARFCAALCSGMGDVNKSLGIHDGRRRGALLDFTRTGLEQYAMGGLHAKRLTQAADEAQRQGLHWTKLVDEDALWRLGDFSHSPLAVRETASRSLNCA